MTDEEAETARQQLLLTMTLFQEFIEWRHKVLTRFAVSIGAIGIAIKQLAEEAPMGLVTALLLVGAGLSFAALMMDSANQRVLFACYQNGVTAEDSLGLSGIFHQLERMYWPPRHGSSHDCQISPAPVSLPPVFLQRWAM